MPVTTVQKGGVSSRFGMAVPGGSGGAGVPPSHLHICEVVVVGAGLPPPAGQWLASCVGRTCRGWQVSFASCPSPRVGDPGPRIRPWHPVRLVPARPEVVGWPPVGVSRRATPPAPGSADMQGNPGQELPVDGYPPHVA